MAAKPHGDTPPKTSIDLDSLEAEDSYEPFIVHVDGQRFQLKDARELDYIVLEYAEQSPQNFFHAALGDESFAKFRKIEIPQWKVAKLMDAYRKHFGLTESAGEVRALPR
jgi:hypothetical protein